MKNFLVPALLISLAGAFLYACGSDFEDFSELDEYIRNLPELTQPKESPEELLSEEPPEVDGDYTCTTKYYKAAPGFTDMTCLDPTTDVIYPAALIKGESIATGAYTPITAARKPISISTSLNGIVGSVARTIDDPKLSTIRQAINDILLQEIKSSAPANMSFTVEEVYSDNQLRLALGANMESATVNVAGSFNFDNTDVRSRIVAKFVQKYYSIDIDIPAQPSDFFKEIITSDDLGAVSPMYISTVTYGRLALFTVESTYSATEIKAALDASYNAAITVGVTLDLKYAEIMNQSTIKAYIVGGSGADATGSINGYEGFKEYITRGGEYSATSPGAPISYKLRFLNNNEIGKIILSSEYTVRDCDLNPATPTKTVRITLSSLQSTNNCDWDDYTIDLYGWVQWVGFEYFWNTTGHNNQVTTVINTTLEQTFTAPFEETTIGLLADLWDWDASSANDSLGGFTPNPTILNVSTLTSGSLDLRVLGGGCNIACSFMVEVIPGTL